MEMRKTPPAADNLYYIKAPAGYNPCILGNPNNRQYPESVLANCTGAVTGRFNELIGSKNCAYLGDAYPGYMLTLAKAQGLTIWDRAAIGGVIVMLKADGMNGHVLNVEAINKQTITTFESGWSYPAGLYCQNRQITRAGNYGMSAAYQFAGCIVNPFVDPFPFEMEYVNKWHSKGTGVKAVQWVLKRGGYYNPGEDNSIDGSCGPATINAIMNYQQRHTDIYGQPLEVDGSAGPLTQGRMQSDWGII